MPFKLLRSFKSINKINDRPPLYSPSIAVQRKWPIFRESFGARGHCLLYSVLTCRYKFQGFNPGCGSRVVPGLGGWWAFQIRVRVKYNVRSFCCYSNTMALLHTLRTRTPTRIYKYINVYMYKIESHIWKIENVFFLFFIPI